MDDHSHRESDPADDGGQRLPYEPPQVISEEVFETMALSCAKTGDFACPGGNPDRS